MMHGRNNGKKMLAVRIVKHAFEIIHLLTNEVEEREREREGTERKIKITPHFVV